MNPFTQLVSPQSLVEAIAASVQLQGLPGRAYRPLDKENGPWRRQCLTLRPDAPSGEADTEAGPLWAQAEKHLRSGHSG